MDREAKVRQAATLALGHLGEPAVPVVVTALDDADAQVRQAAAVALGQIGGEQAAPPLLRALGDGDARVRQAAAQALGTIGTAHAVALLLHALEDREHEVRQAAATALGQIGDARAVALLRDVLRDREGDVRRAAADALDHVGWQPADDATGAAYWIAREGWDTCISLGMFAVEPLIAALTYRDGAFRSSVVQTLGQAGGPATRDMIVRAVLATLETDPDWDVRAIAAGVLRTLPVAGRPEVDQALARFTRALAQHRQTLIDDDS
jgi:HEAT repeat protein